MAKTIDERVVVLETEMDGVQAGVEGNRQRLEVLQTMATTLVAQVAILKWLVLALLGVNLISSVCVVVYITKGGM